MTTKDITFCALFAALIAIGAKLQITIPLQPVPMHFTLQWLFVMLAATLLGKKMGTICVSSYLLIGLIGLPVFASGGGPAYLIKPTFGFLLGFAFAAFVIGLLKEKCSSQSFVQLLIITTVGLLVYYFVGFIYFYFMMNVFYQQPVGIILAFIDCFATIFPDFILCIVASVLTNRLKQINRV